MKFKKKFPKQGGYYWYVDTDYPVAKIGFLHFRTLYGNGNKQAYKEHEKGTIDHIRIGDRIDRPHPQKIEIE